MKVLIVANYNTGDYPSYVKEQVKAIEELGVKINYFGVIGKGISGYLKNLRHLKSKIREFNPDIIHAHYGLSGLLANLQRKIPVITTYHGSDIHLKGFVLFLSELSVKLSAYNLFVGQHLLDIIKNKSPKNIVLPCGVDLEMVKPLCHETARMQLGWNSDKKYILFSGNFANKIKNYPLAKQSVELSGEYELIELKGYDREQVNLLMSASDLLLMTSFKEGSPMVIKEAMACNCPIVSVNIADVTILLKDVKNCFITSFDPLEIAEKINRTITNGIRTNGRDKIKLMRLDNKSTSKKLFEIYSSLL